MSDVVEVVTQCYKKDWKPQTVSTFLAKLCNKKYLKLQRNGKIYTYKILVSKDNYNRQQLKKLCDFLYDGNRDAIKEDLEDI